MIAPTPDPVVDVVARVLGEHRFDGLFFECWCQQHVENSDALDYDEWAAHAAEHIGAALRAAAGAPDVDELAVAKPDASQLRVEAIVKWRNTGDERTTSQLDVYGPGGRWGGPARQGHALIDALTEAGVGEGWSLLVIATPPGA